MEKKMRVSKSFLDLFLKNLKKADLPKRDTKSFLKQRKAKEKIEKELEKLRFETEIIEYPIYKAKAESIGLSFDEIIEISQKSSNARKKFTERTGKEHIEYTINPPRDYQIGGVITPGAFLLECKDITVTVCKQKVCVAQPAPLTVDNIWLDAGSNGTFNKINNNRFTHNDSVEGSSYRSRWGMYHRRSQTHEGKICIWSSTELVVPTKALDVGITFTRFEYNNGACGHGKDPIGLPPSWGRGRMYYQFFISSKQPGGAWVREYSGTEIEYRDTGEVESNIACWVDNVLGASGTKTLFANLNKNYPAGTQFLLEAYLRYWIKGCGEEGRASVHYSLDIEPYMNIEACSMEYPEWVCVPVD